jgi:hypothetical protein
MDEIRQRQLRELAEQMKHSNDKEQHTLAQGTLELLDYVDELVTALQDTTATCCDAMGMVYEQML